MTNKYSFSNEILLIGGIIVCGIIFQITNITFGLPFIFHFNGTPTAYWFNDEIKEIAHIKSLLNPKAEMLAFNYPSFQYLLSALILLPGRLINGALPEDWVISLTSRIISASAVIGSAILLYLTGKNINKWGGYIAAIFLLISPIAVMMAKDMKPIALGGFLLLSAIFISIEPLKNVPESKRHYLIGVLLGLSIMCSHLAISFAFLPVLAYFWDREGLKKTLLPVDESRSLFNKIVNIGIITLIGLTIPVLILLYYIPNQVIGFGEFLYSLQVHTKPFSAHIDQIINYLDVFKNGLLLVSIALVFFGLYRIFRNRLIYKNNYKICLFLEKTYGGMLAGVTVVFVIASILNPLIPLSAITFIKSAREYISLNAGYYGMYPGSINPPAFFEILGYSLGRPLLYLSLLASIILLIFSRTQKLVYFLILAFTPLFFQLMSWNTTYRASRFSYNITFGLVLMAGIFLGQLIGNKRGYIRAIGAALGLFILAYNVNYSGYYLRTLEYERDPRVIAADWVTKNIENSHTIAVKSQSDLPRNLGPLEVLKGYQYKQFGDTPDYCIMDGFEYFVMKQYTNLEKNGYRYQEKDWWPSKTGVGKEDLNAYMGLVNETGYRLIKTFKLEEHKILGIPSGFSLLLDPAEFYHREVYIFQKKAGRV